MKNKVEPESKALWKAPDRQLERVRNALEARHGAHEHWPAFDTRLRDHVLKLRDELRSYKDVRVVMTRDDDDFLKLGERTRIANAKKGDLFISIHCNSLPLNSSRRDEVEGFMVYLLREAKSDADRAKLEQEIADYETELASRPADARCDLTDDDVRRLQPNP